MREQACFCSQRSGGGARWQRVSWSASLLATVKLALASPKNEKLIGNSGVSGAGPAARFEVPSLIHISESACRFAFWEHSRGRRDSVSRQRTSGCCSPWTSRALTHPFVWRHDFHSCCRATRIYPCPSAWCAFVVEQTARGSELGIPWLR